MQEPQLVTKDEMRLMLREALSSDPEKSLLAQMVRRLQDPAVADPKGKGKPHPLWLALALVGAFVLGVFLYFNYWRS